MELGVEGTVGFFYEGGTGGDSWEVELFAESVGRGVLVGGGREGRGEEPVAGDVGADVLAGYFFLGFEV